jgi:DNA-binding PadR family transcriptional regulator
MSNLAKQRLLDALSEGRELSGAQISKTTGLSAGRLYPLLYRMEKDGELESRWANEPHPQRRLYRLPKCAGEKP